MQFMEYKQLYDRLNSVDDIAFLSENGVPEELLLVLLTQKMVRNTKSNYYKVKAGSRKLIHAWKSGDSFVGISKRVSFSPIMTARIILAELGHPRTRINQYLTKPTEASDKRLRAELEAVLAADPVFSPMGYEIQRDRGKRGEAKLHQWLTARGVKFMTEAEQKGINKKTPDFLFEKPIEVHGQRVRWIESKASFGDHIEINANWKKQLKYYVDLFGPGMVVYWFGHLQHDLDKVVVFSGDRFGHIDEPAQSFLEKINGNNGHK